MEEALLGDAETSTRRSRDRPVLFNRRSQAITQGSPYQKAAALVDLVAISLSLRFALPNLFYISADWFRFDSTGRRRYRSTGANPRPGQLLRYFCQVLFLLHQVRHHLVAQLFRIDRVELPRGLYFCIVLTLNRLHSVSDLLSNCRNLYGVQMLRTLAMIESTIILVSCLTWLRQSPSLTRLSWRICLACGFFEVVQ